jgi:hypothetical protein
LNNAYNSGYVGVYANHAESDAAFYKGRIYYTYGVGNPFADHDYRNIQCIDAKTGNLIWNDISKNSESHGTNPIVAYNRVYVPEGNGMRVYDTETGRLIGVAIARNFLYNGGFPKTSVFWKATLDLWEKAGFRPLFQEPFTKLTEFCERLNDLMITTKWHAGRKKMVAIDVSVG